MSTKDNQHGERPNGMNVETYPNGYAIVEFNGVDHPPIRLHKEDLRRVGGALAGTWSTVNERERGGEK